MHAGARRYQHKLLRGSFQRGLDLLARIFGKTVEHDCPHFVAETIEPAEFNEHAVVPQEFIGGRW